MAYLLDTSVLILAIRNANAFQVIDASLGLMSQGFQPVTSIVSHGEVLAFAKKRKWGADKRRRLAEIIRNVVVLSVDQDLLVERYADLEAENELKVLNIGQKDLRIAATAIEFDLTLLTTDGDFDRCPQPLKYIRFDQQSGAELSRRP